MAELTDHPAEPFIRADFGISAEVHPDLSTVVAAEDRAVIDEGDLAAHPCSRHSRTHSGDAASCHDEVILPLIRLRKPEHVPPERSQGIAARRRHISFLIRQPDRIASALKSCPVRQGNFILPRLQPHLPGILPFPAAAAYAEVCLECASACLHAEFPRPGSRCPRRSPVECPYIHMPGAVLWHFNLRHRIGDRLSHAVRKEVGRPHQVHELLVHDPASLVIEVLGLNPDAVRSHRNGAQHRQKHIQKQSFHNCRYDSFLLSYTKHRQNQRSNIDI